ncbi:hypothetical protein V6N12_000949 [Hibiscus sabdariffa]|uniref:Protein kinase domain-containing protein n=1 Tax=Hibiscus sabdariffa TaxID=183260 RepID=A0ABR1ZZU2_9ROSI
MVVNFGCVVLVSVMILSLGVNSEPVQEKQALLAFLSQTKHSNRIQWNSSTSACDWVGVICNVNRSFVYTLRLPAVGLVGSIPPNTIGRLNNLRVLSLRANGLSGEIPADFSNLTLLRSLYLQDNAFSGPFPPSVTSLTRLTRLDLSSNNFSGPIPFGVNNMTHLTGLFLQNNKFSGSLPSIDSDGLDDFNVANNSLNGSIPDTLSKYSASSFAGNLGLCGGPLRPSIVALLLLLFLILCLRKRQRQPSKQQKSAATGTRAVPPAEAGTSSSKDDLTGASTEGERNKLVFFGGGVYNFDLEDLLRASAEVLGKGSVGTSYKAVLEEGTTVVVKRLKDVAVSKKEFETQMETLGKIRHENVVPLRAFYYSKDEKLLVSDFMSDGSLSSLLHAKPVTNQSSLTLYKTFGIRLGQPDENSIKHREGSSPTSMFSGKVVHGNIKASNILLRPDEEACISDFGLNPLFGNTTPPSRVAGYRAPEVLETRKVSFKSDVYSFGVLLLELLTGKAPNQASLGEGIDLPRWVAIRGSGGMDGRGFRRGVDEIPQH